MKKIILIFFFLSGFLKSQNLVPNWSFETYTVCPTGSSQLPSAVPWVAQTNNSCDYYNSCASLFNVPNYPGGYQLAKQGNAYAALYTWDVSSANYREYLQVQLIDTMTNNFCYYVEFYANLQDFDKWATNNLSANLSKPQYTTTGTGFLLNLPQHITRFGNPVIKDTANWVQISGIFVAGGGEKYLTIGNFKNDLNTDTSRTLKGIVGNTYYYIDAASVYSINPTGPLPWSYANATVNFGDSVYIGNTMGGSFSSNWYTLPGNVFIKNAPGLYVKPVTTTTYVVTFTLCGVPRSDTLTVTVNGGSGIPEFGVWNSEFVVSPNPNNGFIQLEILNNQFSIENSEIKIVTVLGEEIKKEKLLNKKQELNLQELSNGIYFLQVLQNNNTLLSKKIIKQ